MDAKDPLEPKIRVLIVEDETIIAMNISHSLERFGCECRHSLEETDIFYQVEEWNPDIILMDVLLGADLNGIAVAEKILLKRNIPIVFLTAFSDDETLTRAKQTMPYGYLTKPFNPRELFITIELAVFRHRSEMEFLRIQKHIEEKQRLESIGLLSSGISHEINNPLMIILNSTELVRNELSKSPNTNSKVLEWLDTINGESLRISKIVKSLMSYTRNDQELLLHTSVSEIWNETYSLVSQILLRDKVNLILNIDPGIPMIYCKVQKLKQLFLHLIQNSREALLEKQKKMGPNFEKSLHITIQPYDSKTVLLMFQDNGIGMDLNETEKSTFPFFTTKRDPINQGLGLALVQTTVREQGGEIFVQSRVGEGTEVRIHFPISIPN